MCCKVLEIKQLQKPPGKWCSHISHGRGCSIYESRPGVCRTFFCEWMMNPALGPDWKPEKSKFVMYTAPDGNMTVAVDPATPAAWREARYYTDIKTNAARLADSGKMLTVYTGLKLTVVLPDRNEEIGVLPPGKMIRLWIRETAGRRSYEVSVEPIPTPESPAGA